MLSGIGPIFQQVADRLAEDILNGTYAADAAVPSTNDYAAFYQISPITAAKGITMLVDQGVLYKRRGIGMFVTADARERLLAARRATFHDRLVAPLMREASLLGIDDAEVAAMINRKEDS